MPQIHDALYPLRSLLRLKGANRKERGVDQPGTACAVPG